MKGRNILVGFSFWALLMTACAPTFSGNRDFQLIRAAEKGQTKEMFRLIRAGADINAKDDEGWTPYLAASTMGHFEAMRLLKSLGAKTDAYEFEPQNVAHRSLSR